MDSNIDLPPLEDIYDFNQDLLNYHFEEIKKAVAGRPLNSDEKWDRKAARLLEVIEIQLDQRVSINQISIFCAKELSSELFQEVKQEELSTKPETESVQSEDQAQKFWNMRRPKNKKEYQNFVKGVLKSTQVQTGVKVAASTVQGLRKRDERVERSVGKQVKQKVQQRTLQKQKVEKRNTWKPPGKVQERRVQNKNLVSQTKKAESLQNQVKKTVENVKQEKKLDFQRKEYRKIEENVSIQNRFQQEKKAVVQVSSVVQPKRVNQSFKITEKQVIQKEPIKIEQRVDTKEEIIQDENIEQEKQNNTIEQEIKIQQEVFQEIAEPITESQQSNQQKIQYFKEKQRLQSSLESTQMLDSIQQQTNQQSKIQIQQLTHTKILSPPTSNITTDQQYPQFNQQSAQDQSQYQQTESLQRTSDLPITKTSKLITITSQSRPNRLSQTFQNLSKPQKQTQPLSSTQTQFQFKSQNYQKLQNLRQKIKKAQNSFPTSQKQPPPMQIPKKKLPDPIILPRQPQKKQPPTKKPPVKPSIKVTDYSSIYSSFYDILSGSLIIRDFNPYNAIRDLLQVFKQFQNTLSTPDFQLQRKFKLALAPLQLNPRDLLSGASQQLLKPVPFSDKQKYYRVVRARSEVYDIVTRSFNKKKGWTQLPHGMNLRHSWNVMWTWSKPTLDISKLLVWQRVNHFHQTRNFSRKDLLKRNIEKIKRISGKCGQVWNIIPQTFNLPKEFVQFVESFHQIQEIDNSQNIWIMKPVGKSRGRGISIVNDINQANYAEPMIIQKYVTNPLLLQRLKFDLRLYVLITSFKPLEAFIYKQGFARLSTQPFTLNPQKLHNKFIHLTNSSIQKDSHSNQLDPVQQLFGGTKISLEKLQQKLGPSVNWNQLWQQIKEVVIKSLIAVMNEIPSYPSCFDLVGYDILIDTNYKAWLIQINSSPSLSRDNFLDDLIKQKLIDDTLDLIDPIYFNKTELIKVLQRRVNQITKGNFINTQAQTNLDLTRILQGKLPRQIGQPPLFLGNYQQLSPSPLFDKFHKLAYPRLYKTQQMSVRVKWQAQNFTVETDFSQTVEFLKAQLQSITGVLPEKQKLMCRGKVLADSVVLSEAGVKPNSALMMMGTANELFEPQQEIKFEQDLTKQQRAKIFMQSEGIALPAGLTNLGNTCYMNSTVQCLRKVKELSGPMQNFRSNNPHDPYEMTIQELGRTFQQLDMSGNTVTPFAMVQFLRQAFPLFNETDNNGRHRQQDAQECWNNLLEASSPFIMQDGQSIIHDLFTVQLETVLMNSQADEQPEISYEVSRKITCIIDNIGNPVNHLAEGIKAGLEGQVQKYSQVLNRDAIFTKTQKINRLPGYLMVQMVRFIWKQASSAAGTKAVKAKILRSVAFPKVLDIYEFCSDQLKASLDVGREMETQLRTRDLQENKGKPRDFTTGSAEFGTGAETGAYELVGVVTHKGRSADSGHYVGWVNVKDDIWVKYDDDIVTQVSLQQILQLKGGGDWHMSYILLYRKMQVIPEE